MVYGFAEQLGGTARIDSRPGAGTTVSVWLPLDPAATAAAAAAEAVRLAALQAHGILDSGADADFDALVAQAARICGVPIALVSLVDEQRQWFKARVGLAASQTPRELAFCAHAIADPGDLLVVQDARKDARFSGNPLVTGEPGVRFYAGAVLRDADHHALGTLCVIDREPRTLNVLQLVQLKELAHQVGALIRARLPAGAPRHAPPPTPAAAIRVPEVRTAAPAGRYVLVVDDEPELCELASTWLESTGYSVVAVCSASEALAQLDQGFFDLLFTDVVMPGGIDGPALASMARQRQPGLRVLFTSGYAQGLLDDATFRGPLLNKPYRKKDLLAAVGKALIAEVAQ
jgi:CheY-like chemotaxis protein